jgi:hypothetical protein
MRRNTIGTRQIERGGWPVNCTRDATELLLQTAREYEQVAEDLEIGAVEIRHSDLVPQNRKAGH